MTASSNDADQTPAPTGLRQTAARGMAWAASQTLIGKSVTFLGYIILATFLLDQHEFGLYAMALTVSGFAALIEQAGLRDVLVFRHAKFRRWANAAFWMSLAAGTLAMLFIAAAAPLASMIYGEPDVLLLLLILALASPLNTLSIVPRASLLGQLRFRYIAMTDLTVNCSMIVMTVLLAWMGLGPISFVLPKPIMFLFRAVSFYLAARPKIRLDPQIRRWKYLFRDSAFVLSTAGLTQAVLQGDRILLGVFFTSATLGVYFLANQLSRQVSAMFSHKLNMVFLPSLSKLQSDPVRQTGAFLRGVTLLAFVTVPACFLIGILADPLSTLMDWPDMIVLMQILAVGGAFHSVGSTIGSLLRAQGRFGTDLVLAAIRTVLFFAFIIAGAVLGGVIGVAIASTLHTAVTCGIGFAVATRPGGGTAMTVWRLMAFPLAGSTVAAVVAALVGSVMPPGTAGEIISMLAMTIGMAIVYLLIAWLFARQTLLELLSTMHSVLPDRFTRRLASIT